MSKQIKTTRGLNLVKAIITHCLKSFQLLKQVTGKNETRLIEIPPSDFAGDGFSFN